MSRASPPPPLLLKKERPRRRCTAASQPVLLLSVVVGILAQGAESLTIEETREWQDCVRSPTTCTKLILQGRWLTGTIPSSIGTFVNLKTIVLSGNNLEGGIPREIGNCVVLERLQLTGNKLEGGIPREIGNCRALETLLLYNNNLEGEIPTEIGNCVALKYLKLENNKLEGEIPTEIGNCRALEILFLSGNNLEGEIPTEIGNCRALYGLRLNNNNLEGKIPTEIGNCRALYGLKLENNKLEGKIPREIGNCVALNYLELHGNNLEGKIPTEIGNCRALAILKLENNKLEGEIPTEIGNCVALETLVLNNNNLEGEIPTEIGNCVALQQLNLENNNLEGEIPTEIGNCRALETLRLGNNILEGRIPTDIGNCVSLIDLRLQNNNLEGGIPTWIGKNFRTLKMLNLQGNKLTGSVPTVLFDMARESTTLLTALNVGDNLLSGPVPIHTTYGEYRLGFNTVKLTDLFTELWLLGNNWDGGPCVGFCDTYNVGQLNDEKRASAKLWASKCFNHTDAHNDLNTSEYSIDREGRCSFKSPTCGISNYYVESRTIADPDCKRCLVHTFQNNSNHNETECYNQPTCGAGQSISIDNDDLRTEPRTCASCANTMYQPAEEHRLTECIAQPSCTSGQYITEDSKIARRVCKACPAGEYQDDSDHRQMECKPHPPCPAGTEFEITSTESRTCTPCGDNEYQDSDDADALQLTCLAQPSCTSGQYITEDSKRVRRVCKACPAGEYQDESDHRQMECKPHPSCPAGTEFEITSTENRTCTPCDDNEYQDSDDADALQLTCLAQPSCTSGQYITEDSKRVRRVCKPCPTGFYQNKSNHRETGCIEQRVCSAGTEFTTTFDADRTCNACEDNEYQDSSDANALQTTCIDQSYCTAGQKMAEDTKTERRQCSDCELGQYQENTRHRNTTCIDQPKCGPGTFYSGSLYAERTCNACPPNTYQPAIGHNEATCIPQQGCLPQHEFVGNATSEGRCIPCKEGALQPKNNHFDVCIDTSLPTTVCSDVGDVDADTGACDCITGFAGPACEFSDEATCNGFGSVSYDTATKLPLCSNCDDPTIAVGDRCQFSNSKTCKDLGSVSADGTCKWEPEVSECPPGYYYNPNSDNADGEDAIEVGDDGCYPCSPGEFASGTLPRVQCDACPTLQISEPASTSAFDCFAKFQTASADQQFCYGEGSITSDDGENVETKPLSRIQTSKDCGISAASLGFSFEGEFVLPYPGCVYDEIYQKARFYVDQSTYDQALSTASSNGDHNNNNNGDDGSRQRRKEYQQHEQRQRRQQQPREQDQQPQQRGHQKQRRRRRKLVPNKDTPLCEFYVCKDPDNEVIPLTPDSANAAKFPSCRVTDAQIRAAVQDEAEKNRKTFVPAMMSIAFATLGGSYAYQYWSAKKGGRAMNWYDVWMHIHVWLTFLRVIDIQTDFGFYFISLRGAFLEAYGDGDPETNPYTEPKVAAFLFAAVFFTALGLFLSPFDIWVMGQRTAGDTLSMFSILIVISISLLEDFPQTVLAGIYMTTMNAAGIKPDAVAILSFLVSAVSLLFSCGTVYTHTQKLREQDPVGWWRIGGGGGGDAESARLRAVNAALNKQVANFTQGGNAVVQMVNPMFNVDASNHATRNDALEAENAALKQEMAQLKVREKKEMEKEMNQEEARSAATVGSNPLSNANTSANDGNHFELQNMHTMQAETQFNGFKDLDGNGIDL